MSTGRYLVQLATNLESEEVGYVEINRRVGKGFKE
jgi:hypothetical protein